MRQAFMSDFPQDEYAARINQMASYLRQQNIDAVILTTRENLRYFSGFQSIVWGSAVSTPGLMVITADGKSYLIGTQSCYGTLLATSCLDEKDIYGFGASAAAYAPTFADAVGKLLTEQGLAKGRLGMEIGMGFILRLIQPNYHKIMSYLSHAEIVDASQLIWRCRGVKSPAEITVMRRTCAINCQMFAVAFQSIFPGKTTEEDVYRTMGKAAFELGAMEMNSMGIRSGKDRYPHGNCQPSSRIIGSDDNEMMLIDGGPVYKGYYSDIIRQAVVGEPTQLQQDAYAYAVDLAEYGMSLVKPGRVARDILDEAEAYAARSAKFYPYYNSHGFLGHSFGLEIHEYPLIATGSDWVIEENMIFTIEPAISIPQVGRFGVEQNILVTAEGNELLTPLTTELYRIK